MGNIPINLFEARQEWYLGKQTRYLASEAAVTASIWDFMLVIFSRAVELPPTRFALY